MNQIAALIADGFCEHQANRLQSALNFYEQALVLAPTDGKLLTLCALVSKQLGNYGAAIRYIHRELDHHEPRADLFFHLADCYQHIGDTNHTLFYLLRAIEQRQDHAAALNNLGKLLRELGQAERAEPYALSAMRADPCMETVVNYALVLLDLGQHDEAYSLLASTAEVHPNQPKVLWNLSLIHLLHERFELGWELYEGGLACGARRAPTLPLTRWQGNPVTPGSLLIQAEQGLGDEVMFASCLNHIEQLAPNTTVQCDRRLIHTFKRSFPSLNFVDRYASLGDSKNYEYICPIGSLPHLFRKDEAAFLANRRAYLAADLNRVSDWKTRLDSFHGVKIGISWRGGTITHAAQRSTPLSLWQHLLAIEGTHWVNLQYGNYGNELRELGTHNQIHSWEQFDLGQSIEDLIAIVLQLDLIITVSNATAHIAGALGKEVWLLLPYAANWRWGIRRNDCLWYPHVQVFRQPKVGDWHSVFQFVERNLAQRVQKVLAANIPSDAGFNN